VNVKKKEVGVGPFEGEEGAGLGPGEVDLLEEQQEGVGELAVGEDLQENSGTII